MYTDLTNSFDILCCVNIALHSPISLSSLVPPCKDILLLFCHDLGPRELKTGNHRLTEDCLGKDLCFHLLMNCWKRGGRHYSFLCFLYSQREFSAQKSSGPRVTLLRSPVLQKNEVRLSEWASSVLQLLYPRSINLIVRQKISTKNMFHGHSPVNWWGWGLQGHQASRENRKLPWDQNHNWRQYHHTEKTVLFEILL